MRRITPVLLTGHRVTNGTGSKWKLQGGKAQIPWCRATTRIPWASAYFWPRIGKQRQVFQANVGGNTEYSEAMQQRVEMEDQQHLPGVGPQGRSAPPHSAEIELALPGTSAGPLARAPG